MMRCGWTARLPPMTNESSAPEAPRSPGRPCSIPEAAIARILQLAPGNTYAATARMVQAEFGIAVSPEYCSQIARGKCARGRKRPAAK